MIGFVCMFSVGYAAFSSEFLISGKGTIVEKTITSENLKQLVVINGDGLYKDPVEANRYVYIYMPDKVLVYDIFAAYKFSDKHILANYSTVSEAGKQQYLDEVFGTRDMRAHFREGVAVTVENHILTLSTCIGGQPNNRYLVQGVLIEE